MEGELPLEAPRPPKRADLLTICQSLNQHAVRYIVVGGMAVIQQGFLRATEDIDLLLDASDDNIDRVRKALDFLPDQAIRDMAPDDLRRYTVVRVVDDIVVDLMLKTCGITYPEAEKDIEWVQVGDLSIPFASAPLLLRMKQTLREKDIMDRRFLERKIAHER